MASFRYRCRHSLPGVLLPNVYECRFAEKCNALRGMSLVRPIGLEINGPLCHSFIRRTENYRFRLVFFGGAGSHSTRPQTHAHTNPIRRRLLSNPMKISFSIASLTFNCISNIYTSQFDTAWKCPRQQAIHSMANHSDTKTDRFCGRVCIVQMGNSSVRRISYYDTTRLNYILSAGTCLRFQLKRQKYRIQK